jgi:hypothetical protein
MPQAVEMVVTVRGETVGDIASAMEAWLHENGFAAVDQPHVRRAAADQVRRNWDRFMSSRDPEARKLYAALEEVGDAEVSLAELEDRTGIRPLGAKLGGQTLSARAILGEPAFVLVRPNVYRRNRNVWPGSVASADSEHNS